MIVFRRTKLLFIAVLSTLCECNTLDVSKKATSTARTLSVELDPKEFHYFSPDDKIHTWTPDANALWFFPDFIQCPYDLVHKYAEPYSQKDIRTSVEHGAPESTHDPGFWTCKERVSILLRED